MNLLQWITGSIRNKMLMITGSGTTLLLLSALLGLWMSWNGINHSQEDALLRIEEEHLIINIEKNLDKEVKEMKNLLLRGGHESAAIDRHWGSVLKHEQLVKEQIQSLREMAKNEKVIALTDALAEAHSKMNSQYREAHRIFVENGANATMADQASANADDPPLAILDELATTIAELAKSANQQNAQAALRSIQITLGMMGGAIVIAFLVFLGSLQKGIIQPARQMVKDLNRLASGDFSSPVSKTTNDEIGQVAASAEKIRLDLGAVIASVKSASSTVSTSAEDLAGNAHQVLGGSSTQSEAASATAAAVEEMTVSIQSVADNAEEVRNLSRHSLENTIEGKQRLEDLARDIAETVRAMEEVAHSVEQFIASTATITSMTQQVKDIADQTNLLALNASIEAARAGEQGRGFAVVADEVRKLAEKSAQSANEIDSVTKVLEQQSQQLNNALDRGQKFLQASQDSMDTASSAMAATYSAMERSSQGVDAITDSVREQTSASNDIARNVEHIANMAEENNGNIVRVSDAAARLQQLAANLQTTVGRFSN